MAPPVQTAPRPAGKCGGRRWPWSRTRDFPRDRVRDRRADPAADPAPAPSASRTCPPLPPPSSFFHHVAPPVLPCTERLRESLRAWPPAPLASWVGKLASWVRMHQLSHCRLTTAHCRLTVVLPLVCLPASVSLDSDSVGCQCRDFRSLPGPSTSNSSGDTAGSPPTLTAPRRLALRG